MVDFPVTSICSLGNFRKEQCKNLGWAKYSLCFLDTAMLIHLLSAAGAFLEAKHIYETTPGWGLRVVLALGLGAVYSLVFMSFFIFYCFVRDALSLIRWRMRTLLVAGFSNFIFLVTISSLTLYFRGDIKYTEDIIDLNDKADIAWITVLLLSATSVFVSLLAGMLALCFVETFKKLSDVFSLFPNSSYVGFSPESPYPSNWKQGRNFHNQADIPRSPYTAMYPHRWLMSPSAPQRTPAKTSPRGRAQRDAFVHELKTTLPNRNEQPLTVL